MIFLNIYLTLHSYQKDLRNFICDFSSVP